MTCAACSTLNGCIACTLGDTGKPQCSACGANNKLKVELDGTITCVAEAQCATNGQEGTHFVEAVSSKCVLCGDTTTGSGNNQGIDNCMTCTRTGSDKPVCNTCKEGYYLDNSKACQACTGANCATCTEATKDKCQTCKPGFFLKDASSGECVPCDDTAKGGREGCSACSNDPTFKCTKCSPNRKPVGAKGTQVTCEEKTCEDETACGGTAGACGAIVVGGDGSMKYHCPQCRQQQLPVDGTCSSDANGSTCAGGYFTRAAVHFSARCIPSMTLSHWCAPSLSRPVLA